MKVFLHFLVFFMGLAIDLFKVNLLGVSSLAGIVLLFIGGKILSRLQGSNLTIRIRR